jgi:multidrug efflux pump subunit AcrB
MILIFLGSPRATIAVLLSVPLSMLVCLLVSDYMGGSINTMLLGGLALVFSRLIDNGVIVLENIFRHMEMGESPAVAAENGGTEVSMAVLHSFGAGGCGIDLRFILFCYDGSAALLRKIHTPKR